MDLGLNGRTALITGGSMGIGRACAEALAAEGCALHLAARGAEALDATRADLQNRYGVAVTCHPADLTDGDQARALADACPRIDILVNNAGAIPRGDLWRVSEPLWRQAWDLKVFGYINLCRAVYPRMREHGRGVIINVIGAGGERPTLDYIAGGAGNAALMAFTRALGARSLKEGIRVLAVNPGLIRTARLESLLRGLAQTRLGDADRWQELVPRTPPPGAPEDVGRVVAFLSSDCARYITGTVVTVDGGATAA
ncbi:short-chain dehydrogenase/reductase [Desulfatitalea alkaliphila]|uniref:Short-chain dehydrogenase/reductase n=1 Tax=Desulfatitalea alkaliphila TaxID=2929485 RepID=A0AA41R2U3_9BACT|nr:short-chain dehydrogenase/reductase [Desulfatitalea alkaliphila]MCJ8500140.1 short-chain dehydrogenase/reductase [Desulfatitalea alkaliphila]